MRLIAIVSLISLAITTQSFASDLHKIGASIDYHLDQESAPGYGAFYQWKFGESIEFEVNYIQSNDIEITNNDNVIAGDFSHLLLGANFIKQYNDELSLKAGTGLGYVTTSSNEFLIEKQTIAPYIKLSANYQINDQFSVEVGQLSHFHKNELSTNHSVFIGFAFQFGSATQYQPQLNEASQQIRHAAQPVIAQQPQTIVESHVVAPTQEIAEPVMAKPAATWFVQLGAYLNMANAEQALMKFSNQLTSVELIIVQSKGYYRIVCKPLINKQRADDLLDDLNTKYKLSGYVTQLMAN
jgi:hypothetical protein